MALQRNLTLVVAVALLCPAYHAGAAPPPDPGAVSWELVGWGEWPRWEPLPVLHGHEYALPGLGEALLGSADRDVRARCALLMGLLGSPSGAPRLAEALSDPQRQVRMFAGISLGLLGDQRGLPAARAALVGTRWWVRYYGVIALATIGGERAKAAIQCVQNDQDELVRAAAVGLLTEASARPALETGTYQVDEAFSVEQFALDAANYLVGESDWWFHRGDYAQVLRCQEAAVFIDPTFLDLYDVNGWLYWSMGRNTEAVGAYRRGIEANPQSWEPMFGFGYHLYNIGRLEAALPYLARAQELGAPPTPLHTYAHALEKAGRLEDSLREWEHLKTREPDSGIPPHHIERLRKLVE